MGMSVCLSVCLPVNLSLYRHAYFRYHTFDLQQMFYACFLWPWICPPLATLNALRISGFVDDVTVAYRRPNGGVTLPAAASLQG